MASPSSKKVPKRKSEPDSSIPEASFDIHYPYIQKFFGKGYSREHLVDAFLTGLQFNLMDPNFIFSVKNGVIHHLVDEQYKDIRRQDYFIIRRYIEDLRNNYRLNEFCKYIHEYISKLSTFETIKAIHEKCFNEDEITHTRYIKEFIECDKKYMKNLRIMWVLAITMYLTWRPHMIVDEFIIDPPTGPTRVLPRVVNYFDKPNGGLKFIQDNLKKLSIVVDTNMIPDNIYNFYGAPYCALRIAQHEAKLLHNRIFELEQQVLQLQKGM